MSDFSSDDSQTRLPTVVGCIPTLLGVVFFAMGSGVLIYGVRNLLLADASRNWPTVKGKVTVSKMGTHRGDKSTTYSADVAYDYTVNGTRYTGDRVTFGSVSTSSTARARRVLNRYPKGKEVTVYYNPEDPEQSVLEPGIHGATWFLPAFGLLFAVVGAAVFVFRKKFVTRFNILHAAAGTPRVTSVEVDDDSFTVSLSNGRVINVPFSWYPRLRSATPEEREYWELRAFGAKIYWPKLDLEIPLAELMKGDFPAD